MGMDDFFLLNNYMEQRLSDLQKSAEEIKKYTNNEEYGLEAIKKSISGNKGKALSEIVCLKGLHKLIHIKSDSNRVPPDNPSAVVFDIPKETGGIIKMLSIKFLTVTTASEQVQDFPFILNDKNGNEIFNFYIHQPRHTGASGTYNTTITLDLIPVNGIDTFKLYDANNNGTASDVYAFSNSNIVSNNVYSNTCHVHIIVPQKGLAFSNGLKLYFWIGYGYNSNNYAEWKMLYEKE